MNNCYIGFYFNDEFEHDISVTLIYNHKNYSIELERLVKVKHSWYDSKNKNFSIHQYLRLAIDYLLVAWNVPSRVKIINVNYPWEYTITWYECVFYSCERHHYLHALSAYIPSKFTDSAILVIDNAWMEEQMPICQSIWYWNESQVTKITSSIFDKKKLQVWIWEVYRLHSKFIGLEEWSLMWLASYWDPEMFSNFQLYNCYKNEVYLNTTIGNGCQDIWDIKQYFQEIYWVDFEDQKRKIQDWDAIETSIFAHIAAKVQNDTENAILYLAKRAKEYADSDNICLAGGVALNIWANTKVIQESWFKNIFVQPASNDWGISLGSALYWYLLENSIQTFDFQVYAWNAYTDEFILSVLQKYQEFLYFEKIENYQKCAQLLSEWKIIATFQGGSEFWPRALWNRSILANPLVTGIKDRLNIIKWRQYWRPVAAVVLEENIWEYFEKAQKNEFMVLSSKILHEKTSLIAPLVHFDGTCRYQTVWPSNVFLYDFLQTSLKASGVPLLINTSFNVQHQPIVESPKEALETFLSTDIDFLLIGNFLVWKTVIQESFAFDPELSKVELYFFYSDTKIQRYMETYHFLREVFFPIESGVDYFFVFDWFWFDIRGLWKITISLNVENKNFYTFQDLSVWYVWIYLDDRLRDALNQVSDKIKENYQKILEKILVCFE